MSKDIKLESLEDLQFTTNFSTIPVVPFNQRAIPLKQNLLAGAPYLAGSNNTDPIPASVSILRVQATLNNLTEILAHIVTRQLPENNKDIELKINVLNEKLDRNIAEVREIMEDFGQIKIQVEENSRKMTEILKILNERL